MLTTVAIIVACVTGIASDYTTSRQATTEVYPQKTSNDYGLKDNIEQQIKRLSEQSDAAYEADAATVARLFGLIDRRRLNTQRTDIFLKEDFPELRQRQANQSAQIAELEQQAETMVLLMDEVTVINSSLGEIYRQVRLLANESEVIVREVNDASTDNYQQEKRLAALKAPLAEQERKLRELENVTLEFRDNLENKLDLIDNITGVVDREKGEQIEAVLTRENPTDTRSLDKDFGNGRPLVLFGFSAIHIADESKSYVLPDNYGGKGYGGKGYGGYQSNFGNASISFNLDVVFNINTKQATLTLIDSSTAGWFVEDVTVAASIVSINNDIYEIEDEVTQPTTSKY